MESNQVFPLSLDKEMVVECPVVYCILNIQYTSYHVQDVVQDDIIANRFHVDEEHATEEDMDSGINDNIASNHALINIKLSWLTVSDIVYRFAEFTGGMSLYFILCIDPLKETVLMNIFDRPNTITGVI